MAIKGRQDKGYIPLTLPLWQAFHIKTVERIERICYIKGRGGGTMGDYYLGR